MNIACMAVEVEKRLDRQKRVLQVVRGRLTDWVNSTTEDARSRPSVGAMKYLLNEIRQILENE